MSEKNGLMGRMDCDRVPIDDGCWMGGREGKERERDWEGETGEWLARGRFLRHQGVTTLIDGWQGRNASDGWPIDKPVWTHLPGTFLSVVF